MHGFGLKPVCLKNFMIHRLKLTISPNLILISEPHPLSPQGKSFASLRLGESNIAVKLTNGNTKKQHFILCASMWFKKKNATKSLKHKTLTKTCITAASFLV